MIILRIKKFANVKTAFGMIALCIGVSSTFVASTTHLVHNSGELLVCYESYCPNSGRDSGIGTLITLLIVIIFSLFLPSLAVTILTSTWSCATFKKYYTGGDDQLNRRMLSLPVIMPLTVMATSATEAIMFLFTLPLGEYLPYWILFTYRQITTLFKIIVRVIYPLILIYTHSDVRQILIKSLLKCGTKFNVNRVTPASNT